MIISRLFMGAAVRLHPACIGQNRTG